MRSTDSPWHEALRGQFLAALDTLGNGIAACPDSEWSTGDAPQPWYLVYHTLFFLDLYLSPSRDGFAPPAPFTPGELDRDGPPPPRVYSKAELRAYLEHGRAKFLAVERSLVAEPEQHRDFGFIACTLPEMLLYGMRHVQHHAAQLNLLLRQRTASAPGWVIRGAE
jgi:hypothetical protein